MTGYEDLTFEEVREAYDHAVGLTQQKRTSPEYRTWWRARADSLLAELEQRQERENDRYMERGQPGGKA